MKQKDYRRGYKQFRVRLRQARLDTGLTQAQVAKKLGRPQSYMSKIETDERRVDFVELRTLAKIYRKPLSYFESA